MHENGEVYDLEKARPIIIGDGCWIASNVTICGGVTIGKNTNRSEYDVESRDIAG